MAAWLLRVDRETCQHLEVTLERPRGLRGFFRQIGSRSLMVRPGNVFTVVFNGEPIGRVDVDESYPTHFFGWFHPGKHYEASGHLLDKAMSLSRQLAETDERSEYLVVRELDKAVTLELTAAIHLLELDTEIEEFAIHHSGEVEVALKRESNAQPRVAVDPNRKE